MSRALRLVTLIAITVIALIAPTLPASAAGPVTVTGHVTDYHDDDNLAGMAVRVYADQPGETPPEPIDQDVTDDNGAFSLEVPAAGDYWFTATDPAGDYRTSTASEEVTGEPITLRMEARAGALTGDAFDQFGSLITDANADLYRVTDDPEGEPFDRYYLHDGGGGHFGFSVPPGDYKLRISGDFAGPNARWYGGTSFADAEVLTVEEDKTNDLGTIVCPRAGYVSGTVKAPDGTPLKGIRVTPYYRLSNGSFSKTTSVVTGADGTYRVRLLTGSAVYRLNFQDALGGYATEWYDDAATLDAAKDISTGDDALTGIDATLAVAAASTDAVLRGTVVDTHGTGIGDIRVTAYNASTNRGVAASTSRRDGTYYFPTLAPGTYKLSFVDGEGVKRYASEFYQDSSTLAGATAVTVDVAGTAVVPATTLAAYGRIHGAVTADPAITGNANFIGFRVEAYDSEGALIGTSDDANANSSGYVVPNLLPGTYKLKFFAALRDDFGVTTEYAREWYSNAYTFAAARTVTVGDGQDVSGVDATLSRALVPYVAPRISGSARHLSTLTASRGSWSVTSGITYSYQWYSSSSIIKGATRSTLRVPKALIGKRIRVKVTAKDSKGLYTSKSVYSAWTAKVRSR